MNYIQRLSFYPNHFIYSPFGQSNDARHAQWCSGGLWNSDCCALEVCGSSARADKWWTFDSVHTGSGTAPTRFPLYFVPSFMRAVKEHQVQQESASDKWHLLLVSVSVRQTDAISLLTGLYEPDISISSQVSHVIFHCTPRNKQNKAQILIYYLTCRQLKVLFSVFFKD